MASDDQKVKTGIEEILRNEIHSGQIVNVLIDRGSDSEGEPVFSIRVIFDNKERRIDAAETIEVRRRVGSLLSKLGEAGAPLFYYVAKSEAGKLAEAQ